MVEFSWYGVIGTAFLGIGAIFTIAACMIDDSVEEHQAEIILDETEEEHSDEASEAEDEHSGEGSETEDEHSDVNEEENNHQQDEPDDYDDAHSEDDRVLASAKFEGSREDVAEQIADALFGSWDDVLASESLEEMAEFADPICVRGTSNQAFVASEVNNIKKNLNSGNLKGYFNKWNSTALGNIAYMWVNQVEGYDDVYREALILFQEVTGRKFKFEL